MWTLDDLGDFYSGRCKSAARRGEGATGAVQQPGFNAGIVSQIKSGKGERGAPPPTVTRGYTADKVKRTEPSTLRVSSRQWDSEPDHFTFG